MSEGVRLDPVAGRARIDVLDILRGIAILGIFYMNVPLMGSSGVLQTVVDVRRIGWSQADQTAFAVIAVFWEGTQRGLLEFLFGAGTMVLTARAMSPDGPVAIADLFYRRNLWLLAFGLVDIFVLCWIGDILHVYALAALFLFPFRRLAPRMLIALGLLFAAFTAIGFDGHGGWLGYQSRAALVQTVAAAEARQRDGAPAREGDVRALREWRELQAKADFARPLPPPLKQAYDEEVAAHAPGAGPSVFMPWAWRTWHIVFIAKGGTFFAVLEAICGMFLGMAMWQLGIIQGRCSARFYAIAAAVAYGAGCSLRAIGVHEVTAFDPLPRTIWISAEFARLAVSFGHLALVNLALKSAAGRAVLAPFKAAGRTAFSLYFLSSIVGLWVLFAPWGFGLWGRYSFGAFALIATLVAAALLVVANVWLRVFVSGPLEWLWRSLSYWQAQPFRRHAHEPLAPAVPGTEAAPLLPG